MVGVVVVMGGGGYLELYSETSDEEQSLSAS
jgi:hypothetical protein